ncbi:hypothetical protein [Wenjunlia tyrosinilytica]|nr:hypothetical protein [Wenjunlia tyrosinilytica]
MSAACPGDGLEHVTAHPCTGTDPVLGLFILAPSLEAAEYTATALCRRAIADRAAFGGEAVLLGCEAAFPAPPCGQPPHPPDRGGRLMPRTDPDTPCHWKGP